MADSLTLTSPADPKAGDKVTFSWATQRPSGKNWIGVYGPAGSPGNGSSWVWTYVTNASQGTTTLDTSKLAGGPYAAYLLYDDGNEILARAAPLTFTDAAAGLSVSDPHPRAGEKLSFTWKTGVPNAKNWIGIYDGDRQPGTGSSLVWAYSAAAAGTLTLDTSGLTGGPYTAYLLYDDLYPILARTQPFGFTPVVPPHAAVDALTAPAEAGQTATVDLAKLWIRPDGNKPGTPAFAKTAGDGWLTVDAKGTVTVKAPAHPPKDPGRLVAAVTDSTGAKDTITLDVPVRTAKDAIEGPLKVASLNLWDAATHVDGPLEKLLRLTLTQNLDVLALQETQGTVGQQLADALGWYAHQTAGSLALVSRFPLTDITEPTDRLPALAATLQLPGGTEAGKSGKDAKNGKGAAAVRIWAVQLDEADYGPYAAQKHPSAAQLVAAEKATTRYAQAQALTGALRKDLASPTPVILAAGLASPSHLDWTRATASSHFGLGPVAWPVTELLEKAGLIDAFRAAHPDPAKTPGTTWSPVRTQQQDGTPEPQDRIDQVQFAGPLTLVEAHTLTTGWPQPVPDTSGNGWPSDHAAAVATFTLRPAH